MDYIKERWSSLSSLAFYGEETKNETVNQDIEANKEPPPEITNKTVDVKLEKNQSTPKLPTNNVTYRVVDVRTNPVPLRKKQGMENPAFIGEQTTTNLPPIGPRNRNSQVIKEQYWTWSCCQKTLTKREKTFLIVIICLTFVIFGLASSFGFTFNSTRPLQIGPFNLN